MGVGVVCSTHTRFRHRRLAGRARVRVSSRALTSGHRLPGTACAVVANAHQTLAQGEEEGVPSRRMPCFVGVGGIITMRVGGFRLQSPPRH